MTPRKRTRHPQRFDDDRLNSGSDPTDPALPAIVGSSARMQHIFNLISKISPTDSSVLIVGESGTGKELVARSIHLQSPRADRGFMAINCGALPENLLESELFGHVRGAFTGAWTDKKGLFQQADRGTLFLDEVGELTQASQVKLLRVLQDSEIRPVGGTTNLKVDVRIVSATNRNLREAMESGAFREDLYYRLNVFQIDVPPLRDRGDDIILLAHFFLERYSRRMEKPLKGFDSEALYQITHYPYPGNVRELENAVQRAVALAENEEIQTEDLPRPMQEWKPRLIQAPEAPVDEPISFPRGWTLEKLERTYIQKALVWNKGNVSETARRLGISRSTLWRKMKQYDL